MCDDEAWRQLGDLQQKITARRIGQMWLHHTGHDKTKGYGDSTREWKMDTVARFSFVADEDESTDEGATRFDLRFTKSRLKNPKNRNQYEERRIVVSEAGFTCDVSPKKPVKSNSSGGEINDLRRAFKAAYVELSDGVTPTRGFASDLVRKVKVDALRDEMRSRGHLETNDSGSITSSARGKFHRAKESLLHPKGDFVEKDGVVWKTERGRHELSDV